MKIAKVFTLTQAGKIIKTQKEIDNVVIGKDGKMTSKDEHTRSKVTLTYKEGRFVFLGSKDDIDDVLSEHDHWQFGGDYSTIDFKVAASFEAYADERVRKILRRAFVQFYAKPQTPLPLFLDRHQVEGVDWVLTRSRSYLAHAPGAGKTCEAIVSAIFTRALGQVVFIVPPSLTANWAREIYKFYPLTTGKPRKPTVSIIGDTASQSKVDWDDEFLIVPDSMLTREWVLDNLFHLDIRFIAVDEASRFKDPRAQRSIALFGGRLKDGRKSIGLIFKPRNTVLLDGSPMPNRAMELWGPTYAMSPESIDFMSEEEFGFRYCGPKLNSFGKWEFKHSSNEAELNQKLTKTFMHVVPESALSHPERRRSILHMNVDARSPKHKAWEKKNLSTFNLADLDEDASQGDLATFRHELGMRKVPWIATYVADRLKVKNESILLFAWHRDVIFELDYKLREFNPGIIMGGSSQDVRERLIKEFQASERKLLILNIQAGGRGYNLQRANRVIFGEFSWSDEMNKQCEKRASRKGNEKTFTRCEYIVSPNSMDEPILNAVFRKAERVKKVIG